MWGRMDLACMGRTELHAEQEAHPEGILDCRLTFGNAFEGWSGQA